MGQASRDARAGLELSRKAPNPSPPAGMGPVRPRGAREAPPRTSSARPGSTRDYALAILGMGSLRTRSTPARSRHEPRPRHHFPPPGHGLRRAGARCWRRWVSTRRPRSTIRGSSAVSRGLVHAYYYRAGATPRPIIRQGRSRTSRASSRGILTRSGPSITSGALLFARRLLPGRARTRQGPTRSSRDQRDGLRDSGHRARQRARGHGRAEADLREATCSAPGKTGIRPHRYALLARSDAPVPG